MRELERFEDMLLHVCLVGLSSHCLNDEAEDGVSIIGINGRRPGLVDRVLFADVCKEICFETQRSARTARWHIVFVLHE